MQNSVQTHNGASVGIDFGLKKGMTLSDGMTVDNPHFLKNGLRSLQRKSQSLSNCMPGSYNRERNCLDLDRQHEKVINQRNAFQ